MQVCMVVSMRTVPLVNLKGGVGKTSTVLGLADAAVRVSGRQVLVIDMDPQANASQCLAPDLDDVRDLTINDVLVADRVGGLLAAVRPTPWPGVSLVPSSITLASRESDGGPTAPLRLRRSMRGLEGFELVLIDCNPSIGLLTVNALAAASSAVIVTEASRASLRGIVETMVNVEGAAELNPGLAVAGIVVNRYDARSSEETYRLGELRESYGSLVWEPVIPSRAVIKTAYGASAAVSTLGAGPAAEVADAYDTLARRLLAVGH